MKGNDKSQLDKVRRENSSHTFLQDISSVASLSYIQKPINALLDYNIQQLRSLFLDFCNLSSFEGFPQMPNLSHLSIIGNKIKSFSGIPIYPLLASIDLSANPIKFDKMLTICAIGSIHLQRINGEDITSEIYENAFTLPPIVGYSLRKGRTPTKTENEIHSALEYLSSEPPLSLTYSNGVQYITTDAEHSSLNWYIYTSDGSWVDMKAPVRALPVTPAVTLKLIKCEYEKNGSIVESYLSEPIGWDKSSPIALINEEPSYVGDMIEGGLVLANIQKECQIEWKLNGEIISTDPCLEIPIGSAGKTVVLTVSPFSSAYPDVHFMGISQEFQIEEPEIEIIKFKMPEELTENGSADIILETYPPNSPLKISIQAAKTIESEFLEVLEIDSRQFIPTRNLVGQYVRASVTISDSKYYAYCLSPVTKLPEQPISAIIDGAFITSHPHLLLFDSSINNAIYSYEWMLLRGGAYSTTGCHDLIFYPPLSAAGASLAVRLTPRDSEHAPQIITSSAILKEGAPLQDIGDQRPIEGHRLQMPVGGHFMLSHSNGFVEVAAGISYTPVAEDVGHFLRFCAEQVDTIIGVVQREPSQIQNVELRCDGTAAGSLVTVDVSLSDPSKIPEVDWYRCSRGQEEQIVQRGGVSYALAVGDVGSKIKARVRMENESRDSKLTPIVRSGPFKTPIVQGSAVAGGVVFVIGEKYSVRWTADGDVIAEGRECRLVHADCGRQIRCEVEMKKAVYYESVPSIAEAPLEAGFSITAADVFRGVKKADLLWYRSDYAQSCWAEVGRGPSYVLNDEDVGCVIRVVNQINDEAAFLSNIVARSAVMEETPPPTPQKKLRLVQSRDGSLAIIGFDSADPEFVWRIWRDGQCNYIDNGTNQRLVLLPIMIGCEIEGGVRVGDEGVVWTENRITVDRALPQPEGELGEDEGLGVGSVLVCHVPSKARVHFSWKRWDGSQFIHIVDNTSRYEITSEDVDCYVCCDIQYVDDDGFVGPALTVRTSGVIPPPSFLQIEGEAVVGEEIVPIANDGFLEGASMCWQRCDAVGWSDVSSKHTYRLSVEDIGCIIRLVATNIDEQRVSQEIGPVEGSEEILGHAEEMISSGSFRWHGKDVSGVTYALDANAKYLVVKGRGPQSSHPWKNVGVSAAGSSGIRIKLGNNSMKLTPIMNNAYDIENEVLYRDCLVMACNMLKNGASK